jgi:predicted NAD/FAD-dependent oxidoreductase
LSLPESVDFCVVGAGFAGLRIAESLELAGADYVVLDKGRSPGGRAATRRIDQARVDHGIPWLTRTGGLSDELIDSLRRDGQIDRLFVGGSIGDGWIGREGINGVAKHLADGLNVIYGNRVESIEQGGPNRLWVSDADGRGFEVAARHVVITAPVPQAIEIAPILLDRLGGSDPASIYEKAMIGLARLHHSGDLPDGVIFENPGPGIASVILESAKFPDRPPSVSIRCDAETSDRLFEESDEQAWGWMAEAASSLPFLRTPPARHQVKRWRYSRPVHPVAAPFLLLETAGGWLAACGDGFDTGASTGLEAALASAQALIDQRAGK